jgi:hypothetical protein
MINRRNVVKDDHVAVPVTHEEDEAASVDERVYPRTVDVDGDRWVVSAKPTPQDPEAIQRQLETYRHDPRLQALRDAARVEFPETTRTVGEPLHVAGYEPDEHGGMTLLQDASILELFGALATSIEKTTQVKIAPEALREVVLMLVDKMKTSPRIAKVAEQSPDERRDAAQARKIRNRLDNLDAVSTGAWAIHQSLSNTEYKAGKGELQRQIGQLAKNISDLADEMKEAL